jgi:hypothetical protein
MDTIIHGLHSFVEALLRPLDALVPWVSLAIIAVPTAVLVLVIVRRTSPQRRVARARAQMAAAIFEMRLYLDHPRQLLRAQARLVLWSVAYVLYLVPSLLVMAGPLGLLYLHLEIRHGVAPFSAPETTVVRIEVADGVSLRDIALESPPSLAVTARVHAEDERALYARIAIRAPGRYALVVRSGETRVATALEADAEVDVVSPERHAGVAALWALGDEPPLTGAIRSITIPYPERGGGPPWWLTWLGLATVLAMLLRGRFRVAL